MIDAADRRILVQDGEQMTFPSQRALEGYITGLAEGYPLGVDELRSHLESPHADVDRLLAR